LYGTSNPDSTTNEEENTSEDKSNVEQKTESENEAQALAAITNPEGSFDEKAPEQPLEDYNLENYNDFEDAANEIDEDEEPHKDLPDNTEEAAATSVNIK